MAPPAIRGQQDWIRRLLPALILGLLSARVEACPVCMPFPARTAADEITASENVVFAREDPDQPFYFAPVECVKGEIADAAIDLFVDSHTRRRLKANSSHVVVLTRASGDSTWRSIGIADDDYQLVIRRILAFADEWSRPQGASKRYEFFLSLLRHKSSAIFELAYLELGRAPYHVIKQIAPIVSKDDLRPLLHDREYIEWRSLAILLLAQGADEIDRAFISESFEGCQKFALTTNLAAWATAAIEIEEATAVQEIEDKYLSNPERTGAEIDAVMTALSVHGRNGHIHLRDRITQAYGVALANHPTIAGQISKDLIDWQKWEHQDAIKQLKSRPDIQLQAWQRQAIEAYLRPNATPFNAVQKD